MSNCSPCSKSVKSVVFMNKVPNNDFLALTCNNQEQLAPFTLEHDQYLIEVWDTGVIYFCPKTPATIIGTVILPANIASTC